MRTVAAAIVAGLLLFAISSLALGSAYYGIVPAIFTSGLVFWLISRQIGSKLEAELLAVSPLLEAHQVDAAKAKLNDVRDRFGPWQLFLDGQIEGQLGMIDYLLMKWDDALPKLEAGTFRNPFAKACVGCIHYRKGRKDEAHEVLKDACEAAPKEVILTLVRATLLSRDGKRDAALEALTFAQKELPDSEHLKNLKARLANKKKIDTKQFPKSWYQFFPEEMAKQMVMRGRRDGTIGGQKVPQQRIGARRAPRR